jgi:hypothetical protein
MPTFTVRGSEGAVQTVPITVETSAVPPRGTFVRGDDMTRDNAWAIANVWGQHSEEGENAGDPVNPGNRFEWRTANDGPLVNGIRTRYRHLFRAAANRRNEIGQVNNQTRGFVYRVGGEYVTYCRLRASARIAWDGSGDTQGGMIQMKHSSAEGNGGFGGNPSSSGPPMGMEGLGPNGANRMAVTSRQGDHNEIHIWEAPMPHNQWFDMALHARYAFEEDGGFINVWYAPNGQPLQLVHERQIGAIKENTQGEPMASTLRFGVYDMSGLDRWLDLGPTHVERIN